MDAGGSETRAVMSTEDAASAFGAILDALSRVISPVLIDGVGWARLCAAVEGLPVDPGSGFGFELRLGERAAGTDFYIPIPPRSALADHYIRLGDSAPPGSAADALRDHLAAIDTGAPWSEILGVEYDVTSNSPGSSPGLFARIRHDPEKTAAEFPRAETVAEWVAGAVGQRLEDGERGALAQAFDGLAAGGGAVDLVGIMPNRPRREVKVVSRAMEPARAPQALERLQWTGPISEVEAFLSAFGGLFRSLRLAVGVAVEGVLPRIGLELFQRAPATLCQPGVGEWEPFLARLCEDGLCLPEKMDALLAWPEREFVFYGRETFGVLTGVAHFKVSFEERGAGVEVEAKAYPVAAYLPFDEVASRFGS